MRILLAKQEKDGHLFHYLVFEKTIIPVAQMVKISYHRAQLQIKQTDGTVFAHPCSLAQWARIKMAFLEGV